MDALLVVDWRVMGGQWRMLRKSGGGMTQKTREKGANGNERMKRGWR